MIGIMLSLSATSFSQMTFSVSKGNSLSTATVGYKFKNIVPFLGFQYYGTSTSISYSDQYYDYDSLGLVTNSYSDNLKASLILPSLGVKYFILEREKLKAYSSLSFTLPILSLKSDDKEYNKQIKEELDKVNIWGSELSFGVEYFFDEQFSVGGEFGLRYIHFDYADEREYTVIDQMTGEELKAKSSESINLNFKPTFTKVSLNFYF